MKIFGLPALEKVFFSLDVPAMLGYQCHPSIRWLQSKIFVMKKYQRGSLSSRNLWIISFVSKLRIFLILRWSSLISEFFINSSLDRICNKRLPKIVIYFCPLCIFSISSLLWIYYFVYLLIKMNLLIFLRLVT